MPITPLRIGESPDTNPVDPKPSKIENFRGFYEKLRIDLGIMDWKEAAAKYKGFVRFIVRTMMTEGEIFLPDFGKMSIKDCRPGGGELKKYVHFHPHRKLSRYVNSCNNKSVFK